MATETPTGPVPVKVETVEGTISCTVSQTDTGKQLFDKIVCSIGLQEFWFFGLLFEQKDGVKIWLHPKKKVVDHDFKVKSPIILQLRVRFYPLDPANEIIQDLTLKYFYRQAKQEVEDCAIYCPAEEALVLSSLATQARYGNHDKKVHRKGYLFQDKQQWLPKRLHELYPLSNGDWEKIITVLYELRKDVSSEAACIEYLSIVQDLYDYSIQYFPVSMKNGVKWLMGVSSFGISLYPQEGNERFLPATVFHWGEITDFSTSLVNEIFIGFRNKIESVGVVVPSFTIAKHIIRQCLGMCNLILRCRNPPQEVSFMRNKKEREREELERERAGQPQIRDGYPSAYLYGRGRHHKKDKKRTKVESLKESDLKKTEATRFKYIQKQITEYERDIDKADKEIAAVELVAFKRKDKATQSFTDWQKCETELRGDDSPIKDLTVNEWLEYGYNMNDRHWMFEASDKKLKAHCMKKYSVASNHRGDMIAAVNHVQEVKDKVNSMTSPAHLHIDDGSSRLDESDPNMVADIPVFPDGLNPFPWEDQESHEDSDLHIQQDLQSTQEMLIKVAQRILEDEIDMSFKDQTQGFSKYRIYRLFIEIPLEDRILVMENGEDFDPEASEATSGRHEAKRYEAGLLGKRLKSKQGFISQQGQRQTEGLRPAARMHLPEAAPGEKSSYDFAAYVEDL